MRYEAPEMEILYLEAEDIITLSNDGTSTEENGGSTDMGGDW